MDIVICIHSGGIKWVMLVVVVMVVGGAGAVNGQRVVVPMVVMMEVGLNKQCRSVTTTTHYCYAVACRYTCNHPKIIRGATMHLYDAI